MPGTYRLCTMSAVDEFELQVVAPHGHVGRDMRQYAETKVRAAARVAPRPVLFGRVTLSQHVNPSTERRATAKASLDVGDRPVRAHVAAATIREAIDLLEERLRRRLEILTEHLQELRTSSGVSGPGEWRHASLPAERLEYFPRPEEEREVVRHKTYELASVTPQEAALDLELLDYDFHLFTNAETGEEAVVYRKPDGSLELAASPAEETVETAIERLELTAEPFVFFRDTVTRRGNLLYYRYDGHYGLITPVESGAIGASEA
jgi:ribosome-associated translation inhibitor RaiA